MRQFSLSSLQISSQCLDATLSTSQPGNMNQSVSAMLKIVKLTDIDRYRYVNRRWGNEKIYINIYFLSILNS